MHIKIYVYIYIYIYACKYVDVYTLWHDFKIVLSSNLGALMSDNNPVLQS